MNYADYNNKLTYPSKSDFTVTFFYSGGERVATCHNDADIKKARAQYPTAVTEKVVDQPGYSAAQNAYDSETRLLREQFIVDLFNEYNLDDNPFTRKLYSIAYQQGHSNGYADIESAFSEIYELDKLARQTYGK